MLFTANTLRNGSAVRILPPGQGGFQNQLRMTSSGPNQGTFQPLFSVPAIPLPLLAAGRWHPLAGTRTPSLGSDRPLCPPGPTACRADPTPLPAITLDGRLG